MIRQIQNNDGYGTVIKKHVNGVLVLLTLALLQAGCNEMVRPADVAPVPVVAGRSGPAVSEVAAGLLRGDGMSIGPVVNGLKITRVDTGELVIVFDGYRMPTAQFQYVVKVLPINSSARASLLSVYFIEYLPDGIRFNVRHGNTNLSVADLQMAQFMFEVSLIE
jgi:hypothetical protein